MRWPNQPTKIVVHRNGETFKYLEGKRSVKNQFISAQGYPSISFRHNTILVHRLIAKGYIPNPQSKREVNHKNGIRNDNRICNLEWVTPSENIQHSYSVLGRKSNKNKGGGSLYWDKSRRGGGAWVAKITVDHKDKAKVSKDKKLCASWLEDMRRVYQRT